MTSGSEGDGRSDSGDQENASDRADAVHAVVLDWIHGGRETVQARGDESILDAAEAAGVGLPFGCRTGACATCTARLRSGSVEHTRPPRALDDCQLADGYVLACIARATADCHMVVGADVASELVSNPWK